MPFPSRFTLYTYVPSGVSFIRKGDSDNLVPWFEPEDQYTKDPVLPLTSVGGGQVSKVYIHRGAAVCPPLLFRASCLNSTDRYTLHASRGTTGTLIRTVPGGGTLSATVFFYKAIRINAGDYSHWWLDVGFELVP